MITSPLAELFPSLARHARTATRLHPRPGEVTALDSHVGGPLLWPADEPWPTCADKREDEERGVWRRHDPPNPLLPVAQLRAADVPDLPRPKGKDLLQVLWCPAMHKGPPWGPVVRLRWRRQADVTDPLTDQPASTVDHARFALRPCRLSPERVVEYPPRDELPVRLRKQVEDWDSSYDAIAVAPGWKVGGYTTWPTTGFMSTSCPGCGGRTRIALVIATSEAGHTRWQLPPDQRIPDEPTGVLIGRYGSMRIFVCVRCPGTPFIDDIQ